MAESPNDVDYLVIGLESLSYEELLHEAAKHQIPIVGIYKRGDIAAFLARSLNKIRPREITQEVYDLAVRHYHQRGQRISLPRTELVSPRRRPSPTHMRRSPHRHVSPNSRTEIRPPVIVPIPPPNISVKPVVTPIASAPIVSSVTTPVVVRTQPPPSVVRVAPKPIVTPVVARPAATPIVTNTTPIYVPIRTYVSPPSITSVKPLSPLVASPVISVVR